MLLPWYVNHSLTNPEKIRVEAHLKDCLSCRMELAHLKKIASLVRDADLNPANAEPAYAKLLNRIQESQKAAETPIRSSHAVLKRAWALRKTGIGFKITVFAQAAVILLAIGFFWIPEYLGILPEFDHEFHTLSSGEKSLLNENEIRVVFVDPISDTQISRVLQPLHASIVAGPSAQGVYIVRVSARIIEDRGIGPLVERLRENKHIIFAEPALSALSSNIKQ